ncbi:MgtC/SapB family protein [Streptomyces sp. GS7]|nr:MgtC/SapB family protein [Streptomyces sp. GS7]
MVDNIAAGLGFAAAIGLERQWRARMAGLRTNALVAAGSAPFVLFVQLRLRAGHQYRRMRRLAAQIVSGISFLGAGVIIRDGLSVRGLNTAAELWCSVAVGALAGTGLYVLAGLGTVAVVGANLLLRPLGRRLDREPRGGAEVATDYYFEAVCTEPEEAHIRALIVQAVAQPGFRLRSVFSRDAEEGKVTVAAELTTERRDDSLLETAVSRLSLEPAVSAVSWTVIGYPAENGDGYPAEEASHHRFRNFFTGRRRGGAPRR